MSPYDERYFRNIEKGYFPWGLVRDKMISAHIKSLLTPGKRILEIGCGTGNLLRILEDNFSVYGLDISPAAVQIANARLKRGKVATGNIEKDSLDFPGKFDGVVMINVLEHLLEPGKVLKKINAISSEGGYLFLQSPVISSLGSELLSKIFYGEDTTHIHVPTVGELRGWVLAAGYSCIYEASGTFHFLPLLGSLFLDFFPCYFGVYRKSANLTA